MGEWGREEGDAHSGRLGFASVAVVGLARIVNVLMIIGGLGLVVWMHL
jgi:nitrate reductase NapE component